MNTQTDVIYHIDPQQYPGFIGTLRRGSVDRGAILAVLTRRGDWYETHVPGVGRTDRVHVGDGREGQLLAEYVHPA